MTLQFRSSLLREKNPCTGINFVVSIEFNIVYSSILIISKNGAHYRFFNNSNLKDLQEIPHDRYYVLL